MGPSVNYHGTFLLRPHGSRRRPTRPAGRRLRGAGARCTWPRVRRPGGRRPETVPRGGRRRGEVLPLRAARWGQGWPGEALRRVAACKEARAKGQGGRGGAGSVAHHGEAEVREDVFTTVAEAESRASEIGCIGYHSHEEDGTVIYMPCETHEEYTQRTGREVSGYGSINNYIHPKKPKKPKKKSTLEDTLDEINGYHKRLGL